MPAINPLPTPPSRNDPANFSDRADAFLAALPAYTSEANALLDDVHTSRDTVQTLRNEVIAAGLESAAANAATATTKAAEAASSASEAFGYLQAYRATSYGALAADPVVDPNGNPPTVGDEYFNTSMNLLKRFNGVTWQASDITTANLAVPGGSQLVGYDGGTAQDVLDNAKPMANYTALRAYTGRATGVRITQSGLAGFFQRDDADTTSSDNGGTIIVDGAGRRWRRLFTGAVNVKWFGAVGDGVTDDTAAIQAADTYAGANGKVLIFDGVDYLIQSPLTISAPWIGTPRKTRIVTGSPFTFPAPTFDPRNYSAITNKNCAAAFNSSTADSVFIYGIDFLNNATNVVEIVALANVRNGEITNCNFTTGTNAVCNPLDLFACVKNFKVEKCEIRNLTQNASGGGGMWIRNITSNGALAANVTENIQVVDCYFEQTSIDEALAVYGVNGMTKNVRVSRCTFNGNVASTQRHGNLVTAFPLGSTANAAVQDVVFSECRFESNNFINHVLRIGQAADASRVCKYIVIRDSYFKASLPTAEVSAVARNIPCVGGNVTFANNIVDAEGSAAQITYGVQSFNTVTDSTVLGNLSYAFASCGLVDACVTKSITDSATFNCKRVSNCTLSSQLTSIVNNVAGRFDTLNNSIEVLGTSGSPYGVFYNAVAGSAPFGEISGNIISLNNANAVAIRVAGTGVSTSRANNNTVAGIGKTIQGTQYKEVQGNNWYGALDSMRSAGYLDYDHNYATPIGTFASAATHTAGANSYLLGFIKTANAGSAADWKPVYAGSALT